MSRVVSADQLLATADELAQRIAANPPHAVRLTRHWCETMAAFLAKRPAVFKG